MSTSKDIDLSIEGMSCAACVNRIERAVRKLPGVENAQVNLATEQARVSVADDGPDAAALIAAVVQAGYQAHEMNPAAAAPEAVPANDWRELALVVGGGILTLILNLPMLTGLEIAPLWQWLLATPVQLLVGARFYAGAWAALKDRSANMDVLVAIGTSAAYGLSVYQALTVAHHAHLYFEAGATVIVLVRLGKWLEMRARRRASAAIRALHALRPATARVQRHGQEADIPVAQLRVGDRLVLRPGELIAADARVLEGRSQTDESMMTGESRPVDKAAGAALIGGSVNGSGLLLAEVTAVGTETVLAGIIRAVENAQLGKAPVQRMADRVTAVFVPVILLIALITLAGWLLAGAGTDQAIINAVAVLVIACPCALGLATPAAIMAGTGTAARQGILIRDVEALELLHSVQAIAFDKTGTLTEGKPRLVSQQTFTGSAAEHLRLAAAMQKGSEHPLAKAVLDAAAGQALPTAVDMQAVPGQGVQAEIDGARYVLGNRQLLAAHGITPEGGVAEQAEGHSLAWLARVAPTPALLGLFAFGDALKPEAAAAVAQLHAQQLRVLMLSGDNVGSAEKVAATLGIREVHAGLSPTDKAAIVARLHGEGVRVAMVGDGINDAPALAAADVGIAMGSGTDVAMHTAGVTLMRGDPRLLAGAIDISRRTWRKILQNLFWAFIFNVAGIPLAAFGKLNPMIAGAMMAVSSVFVVSNALLLTRWKSGAQHA
ncbi:cation-translocating P-type ATPase [Massilia sp. TS11]|uniref:heavy metal translocating P-type ATPase n=1 Tax=Massilia sp. TS11 TaxID=2908003 RepID=UPI001EDA0393|nr:heavy metal translocating P-type ATPase [Massilia sp. TS11]MCG2584192.1 heavy metal translocating P-type ATPase [Massilia sp. TS11]